MAVMGLLPPTAQITGSVRLRRSANSPAPTRQDVREDPRQGHRDDLPGADDVPEPGAHHRPADRRKSAPPPPGTEQEEGGRARAVRTCLDLVGIPAPAQRVDEYPHQLSGGMRRRAMIAIAVACDPAVLIADAGRRPRSTSPSGGHPGGSCGRCANDRHRHRAHHPRPGRRRRHRRPRPRHVRGPPRRDRPRSTNCSPRRHPYTAACSPPCSAPSTRTASRDPRSRAEPSTRPARRACVRRRAARARTSDTCTARPRLQGRPGRNGAAGGPTPRHRAACWHPHPQETASSTAPRWELTGLERRFAVRAAPCAPPTASPDRRTRRGRRPRRRVRRRQVDRRTLRRPASTNPPAAPSASTAPTSPPCPAIALRPLRKDSTWSSRTRPRRSTRG
ncbi:ATP-binding cassette domain-containing protein [Streptomyces sp. KL116D]|uniref:ATP-binding cassette domain-containing protein n=1 Tax=Streptomyces sp. KL116D TaxID=3045152 RepID=UPI0035583D71